MPEWNGMEDLKNGMEDNPPFFHTHSMLDFVHCIYKKIYKCRVVIDNNVTEVFNFSIYVYCLLTNRSTLIVKIAPIVYVLHHPKRIAICSIDV